MQICKSEGVNVTVPQLKHVIDIFPRQIDRRRRAFHWSGTYAVAGGSCKVAWLVVCTPKCYGGLGVPDLRILGFALRLRWEWPKREPGAPA